MLTKFMIIIFSGCIGLFFDGAAQHFFPSIPISYHLVSIVASLLIMFPLGLMRNRQFNIDDLSYKLFTEDSLFDNNIRPFISGKPFTEELLLSSFCEFKRGNYSREFRQFLKISQSVRPEAAYYHFHYVERRVKETTETDSEGRTQTKREIVYDHYDRYGLIFDFAYGQGLSLNSSGCTQNQVNYTPSYALFNKKFDIGANSEISAARMLKPALQFELFEETKDIPDINIQISNNMLLIGTNKNILTETRPKHTLKTPQAFYNELLGMTEINFIEISHQIYSILTKHLDDNFS